jgi:ribose transport system ATP-binding protein
MDDKPATLETPPRLRMVNIRKSFPGVQAVRDVTLKVYSGEILRWQGRTGPGRPP